MVNSWYFCDARLSIHWGIRPTWSSASDEKRESGKKRAAAKWIERGRQRTIGTQEWDAAKMEQFVKLGFVLVLKRTGTVNWIMQSIRLPEPQGWWLLLRKFPNSAIRPREIGEPWLKFLYPRFGMSLPFLPWHTKKAKKDTMRHTKQWFQCRAREDWLPSFWERIRASLLQTCFHILCTTLL